MKKNLSLLCIILLQSFLFVNAQTIHRCATHEVFKNKATHYPGYAAAVEHAFNYAKAKAEARKAFKGAQVWDTIFRIPVVVHIVYNTPDQNLDDSLIYNQIEVLNQDYRRLNADTGNTRSIFKPVASDAGIEFFLATEDPDGNPSTGITRTATDTTAFPVFSLASIFSGDSTINADKVKKNATGGSEAWDTDNYLNIWVCNMKDPTSFLGQVLGFAYPPDNSPDWPAAFQSIDSSVHGIVIHYEVFGRNNPLAVGDLDLARRGRTVVHEVGHYLSLHHIWGDVLPFSDGCALDDFIADTPNSSDNSQQAGCDTAKNTCTEGNPDLPDMFENYMDYSREECQNVFTHGQAALMRATLTTSRKELPYFPPASGIGAVANTIAMQLYPNPTDGMLNITFAKNETVTQLTVHDLVGKTWLTLTPDGKNNLMLDLNSLPGGIYAITANSIRGMAVRKIVVN